MQAVLVILVALLAVSGIFYCLIRPRYAIVPVLMFFPAEQILMGYLPEFRWKYGWLPNVVVGLIAVVGVASHFFRGEKIFEGFFNKSLYLIMGLLAYMLLSMVWTPAPESAEYFLKKSWAYFFLFYLVAPLLIRDLNDLKDIPVPMMIVGVGIMFLMLVNPNAKFINDRFTIDLGYQVGFGVVQSNPLAIADAGGILAIIAALYRPTVTRPALIALQIASIVLGLTLALLSGSRGQVVAAVGIIAVTYPFATGSASAIRVAGTLLLVGALLAVLYFVYTTFAVSAAQARWSGGEQLEGLGARFQMISTVLESYGTQPAFWLTGLGASAFNAYYTFRTTDNPHWYPHNIIVESMTEYGLIGLVMLGGILYVTVRYGKRMVQLAGRDRTIRTTAVIFVAITLFHFLVSLKQGYLLGMPPMFMFCLFLARIVTNEEKALAEYQSRLESDPEFAAQEALDLAEGETEDPDHPPLGHPNPA